MPQKTVIGNWKMNGDGLSLRQLAENLVSAVANVPDTVQIAVCPPFPYLGLVEDVISRSTVHLGAQDVSSYAEGPYTGQVSANMLHDLTCRYCLVGHSERRTLYSETNDLVADKFLALTQAGIIPVLCIGESLPERQHGLTHQVLEQQLRAVLDRLDPSFKGSFLLAYEPVWAIGTGQAATPDLVAAVHLYCRELLDQFDGALALTTPILYGGSVKPDNAAELMAQPNVDGALVGGAALNVESFAAIVAAASHHLRELNHV